MTPETPRQPLATPEEVAMFRRISKASLAQERYLGTGPKFRKLGRRVFYDWPDIYDWVDAHTRQRTDDRPGAVA
jgi:hypothetical protein